MADRAIQPRIEVEGRSIVPREVTASFWVQTENWVERKSSRLAQLTGFAKPGAWLYGPDHARAMLEIEIEVDDESGADCALFPHLLVLFRPDGWEGTDISALAGRTFVEGDGKLDFEAYYGNDAPTFEQNRVQFETGAELGEFVLDWSAQFRWRRDDPVETFRFCGPIRIEGLKISLKRLEDLDPIMSSALPGFDVGSQGAPTIVERNFGPPMPRDRRHWKELWFAVDYDD